MPANSTGTIVNGIPVVALAAYAFSRADGIALLRRIPLGGTTLTLPGGADMADRYELVDVDGSCSGTNPIVLKDATGATVSTFTTAKSWAAAVFDQDTQTWAIESSPGSGTLPTITLTGDTTGSGAGGTVPTVTGRINGSTVPAGGALTTGNALQVTGAATLGYAPINLAGGPNFVTGALPVANQAALAAVNIASLQALSAATLSQLQQGSQALVGSVGAYWAYQPAGGGTVDGITVVAATNGPAGAQWWRTTTFIAQKALAQAAWFVGGAGASDENTGATSGAPLATKAERYRRMGGSKYTPTVTQTITYQASDTTNADPIIDEPQLNGFSLIHTAALPAASFTGSLLAVTPKNAATNQPLQSTFTTTTGAVAANMLLVNATRGNSVAFAQRNVSGGTWNISQPFAPYAGSGLPSNTEVDTWANGDAISGFALINVACALLGGRLLSEAAGFGNGHVFWRLNAFDTAGGAGFDAMQAAIGVVPILAESVIARSLTYDATAASVSGQVSNCAMVGGEVVVAGGQRVVFAGGYVSGGFVSASNATFGHDIILRANNSTFFDCSMDAVFGDGAQTWTFNGYTNLVGPLSRQYGAQTLNALSGNVDWGAASAVTTFPTTGGLKIGGKTTAYSALTSGGLTAIHGGIALTAANLDAAAGAAGFGGLAFVPGVASFGTAQP